MNMRTSQGAKSFFRSSSNSSSNAAHQQGNARHVIGAGSVIVNINNTGGQVRDRGGGIGIGIGIGLIAGGHQEEQGQEEARPD